MRSAHATAQANLKPGDAKPEFPEEMTSNTKKAKELVAELRGSVAEAYIPTLSEDAWARIVESLPEELVTRGVCKGYPNMSLCNPAVCGAGCAMRRVYEAMEADVAQRFDATMAEFTMDSMANPAGSKTDQELQVGADFSSPWPASFADNAESLEKELFIMKPEIRDVLDIWQKFDHIRLFDIVAMNSAINNEAFEIDKFVHAVVDRSEEVDEEMCGALGFTRQDL
jgi:hypothetical protein